MSYFILFACCIPVKGAKRSIICDLQRGNFRSIPNDLFLILTEFRNQTIDEIKANFPKEDHLTIDEYIEFLHENEFGFWTNAPEKFPQIDTNFRTPALISNAIIDFCEDSDHPIEEIFSQLEFLGCKDIQLRFFDFVSPEVVKTILEKLNGKRIKSVEILLPFNKEDKDRIINLLSYNRISSIIFHGSEADSVIQEGFGGMGRVVTIKQPVLNETHCGIISPLYFVVNLPTFMEAKQFNSCLHKKISIDKFGEIKNCPSTTRSFGNISQMKLAEVVDLDEFKILQNIPKDLVEDCRDCEFRYICTDCRAYTKDQSDPYSKPAKCSYDPYSAVWI